jgi:hypothetical protein
MDDLIGQLVKLREQRAELDRQEKAVTDELRARHQAHAEALTKLGILPPPAPLPPQEIYGLVEPPRRPVAPAAPPAQK